MLGNAHYRWKYVRMALYLAMILSSLGNEEKKGVKRKEKKKYSGKERKEKAIAATYTHFEIIRY